MKKILLAFYAFCVLIANAQVKEVKYGQLYIDGTRLTDRKGNEVILRGVTYGSSDEEYAFYNSSSVSWLATDWNCSVVRATVGVEQDNGYLKNPEQTLKWIENVIQGAIDNGIYVVVAWHCHNMHLEESKQFFNTLASKYGKYPNIIYEIFTEPDDEKWVDLKPYYEDMILSIRNYDHKNIILLSAPYWTQNVEVAVDDPLETYSNIMYTVHFCTGNSGDDLREACDYVIMNNYPIFVSDHLLTDCSCDSKIFINEWSTWLNWFEKNNISWITWNISSKDQSCSLLKPTADKNGAWDIEDLTEGGKLVREKLREFD